MEGGMAWELKAGRETLISGGSFVVFLNQVLTGSPEERMLGSERLKGPVSHSKAECSEELTAHCILVPRISHGWPPCLPPPQLVCGGRSATLSVTPLGWLGAHVFLHYGCHSPDNGQHRGGGVKKLSSLSYSRPGYTHDTYLQFQSHTA